MKENEHFWLGVTLSDDPAPDNLFVVASYGIKEDGAIGSIASRVIDPVVRGTWRMRCAPSPTAPRRRPPRTAG